MDSEVSDQLRCPICFQIPLKEIYQCENGHTFCDNCAKSIHNMCPQCRVFLGRNKIRNRALESLLDVMKFECSFKVQGCTQKVFRKDIDSHNSACKFGGENVTLCDLMEFDCNYVTNSRKLGEAVNHFVDAHKCVYTCEENVQVILTGAAKFISGQTTSWEPTILDLGEMKVILLVKSQLNTISFNCIGLGDQKNKWKMEFAIVGKSTEIPNLEWSITPMEYLKLKALGRVLPYQFPFDLLKEYYTAKDSLYLRISAYKDNSTNLAGSSKFAGQGTSISISPRKKTEDSKLNRLPTNIGPSVAENIYYTIPPNNGQTRQNGFYRLLAELTVRESGPKDVEWVAAKNGNVPLHSFPVDPSRSCFIIRATHGQYVFPGNLKRGTTNAYITYGGKAIAKSSYEVLTAPNGMLKWIPKPRTSIPENAVSCGTDPNHDTYYIGLVSTINGVVCGKIHPRYNTCYVANCSNSTELEYEDYQILVKS